MSKPISNPSSGNVAAKSFPTSSPLALTVANGPVFDDPKHHIRIYQGDCLEILAQIPESSVDLVFADPP